MKKANFYSYHRKCGGRVAILHEGYDDGTFYYYKSEDGWYCIDKLSGLSVLRSHCDTKAEAYEQAHSEETMNLYSNVKEQDWYQKAIEDFEVARMEAINK